MSAAAALAPATAVRLVARGVFIELRRRRDLYVVLLLVAIYVLGVLAVRLVGIESPATGTFLLNLGLMLASAAAHILTVLLTVRQIPGEIEARTLCPLLAKPLERHIYVLGKWMACTLGGIGTLGAMTALVWWPAPKLESYSSALLAQAIALQAASLALLAALGLLLSLVVPRGVALVLLAMLVFLGGNLTGFVSVQAQGSAAERPVAWLLAYVPDFSKLNLFTRLTDGIAPLPPGEFAGLLLWAAVVTAAALALSTRVFERRPL